MQLIVLYYIIII